MAVALVSCQVLQTVFLLQQSENLSAQHSLHRELSEERTINDSKQLNADLRMLAVN